MAKSISVVVPPNAAALVPVSKSSLDVVPPKGMSRWVCTSMPPGISSMPVASITACAAVHGNPRAISLMRSPSIRMSALRVSVAVTTVPLRIRISCHFTPLLPGFRRHAVVDALHGDAVFHGTHQPAQVAADAFVFIDAWNAACGSPFGVAPSSLGIGVTAIDRRVASTRSAGLAWPSI